MKKFITLAIIATLFAGVTTSCIKDLDVIPIDPNLDLPSDILSSEAAYGQVLAQCYAGLSESSSIGIDSDPNIDGVDGGYGQYMRALFYLNEIPTDEANCCWNDKTLSDIRRNKWATSDVFVMSMFARIYFQISQCNEFIRKANASQWADSQNMKQWIAEARALRALSYYHAIDMFGNLPFATEENTVGSVGPESKSRADMYEWLVKEIQDFTPGLLKRPDASNYGRCTQMMAKMLLAKLYLNAEVYTGGKTSAWKDCAAVCKEIMAEYPVLHDNWSELFGASNKDCLDEIIFVAQSDPRYMKSYGNTTFLIKATIPSGNAALCALLGVGDGWGGLTVRPEFVDLFDESDPRYTFHDCSAYVTDPSEVHTKAMTDDSSFPGSGLCVAKFTNLLSDGSTPADISFPETDCPVFRSADAYLMLAECGLHDNSFASEGQSAMDKVRARVGLSPVTLTAESILAERGRELYWECHRRSDLVRFGKYAGAGQAVWSYKGGVPEGQEIDAKYNLFPIPANEINSNPNLVQNPGY